MDIVTDDKKKQLAYDQRRRKLYEGYVLNSFAGGRDLPEDKKLEFRMKADDKAHKEIIDPYYDRDLTTKALLKASDKVSKIKRKVKLKHYIFSFLKIFIRKKVLL